MPMRLTLYTLPNWRYLCMGFDVTKSQPDTWKYLRGQSRVSTQRLETQQRACKCLPCVPPGVPSHVRVPPTG